MNINSENVLIQGRIRELIKEYSSGVTDFATKIGTHQSTLSRALSIENTFGEALINKIVIAFGINKEWILTGTGEKISSYHENTSKSEYIENIPIEPLSAYLPSSNFKLLPLYSFDVVGGVNNQEADTAGFIMGYMPFVNAKDDDISVLVTGNSMYPTFPAGSYIQIRKIQYWREFLEFGQVHIIELLDDRRLIKEIRKGCDNDHFRLISHNEKFDEVEISTDFIRSIWLVLSKYEKSTM